MKIKLLDIKGFGKFNQSRITPGEGFNMIYAPNESGKSTLQAFIRAMLYGQKGGRKAKDGSLPPAKQYKPWHADQYAGVLEYTLNDGSSFRVGRNFDKGTVNIHDAVSNNLTADFPQEKDVGPKFAEAHLGLDEVAFEKSIFIRQMQSAVDEDGRKSLVEKLSNLNATGNEDLSLSRALEALDTALIERVGTGRTTTRPLDKVNLRLNALEEKKQQLIALNDRYLDMRLELHDRKRRCQELSAKLEEKKALKKVLHVRKLKAVKESLESLNREAGDLDGKLKVCQKDLEALRAYEQVPEDSGFKASLLLHDIEQTKQMLDAEALRLSDTESKKRALEDMMEPEEIFRRKIETVEESLKRQSEKSHNKAGTGMKSGNKVLSAILGILALGSVGMYFALTSPVILALAAVLLVASVVVLVLPKKEGTPVMDVLSQTLLNAGFRDMADFLEYKETQLKYRSQIEQLTQKMHESGMRLKELEEKAEVARYQLTAILGRVSPSGASGDAASLVASLKDGIERLKKCREDQRLLSARRKSISDQYALKLQEAGNICGYPVASLKELERAIMELGTVNEDDLGSITEAQLSGELSALEDQLKMLQLEITALNTRLEQAPSEGELSAVLEEIALLQEKKAELEMTGASLTLASQVLADTALKLQRDYIPELNQEMSKLLSQMTKGRYTRVHTNDALQVNLEVPETDELIHVSRLSGGTIDQVYLCMRLAAVQLLERGGETLPLFLDEPFSQYDEDRVRAAFEVLKDISAERQIFFFTCREREYELARSVFGNAMTRISL